MFDPYTKWLRIDSAERPVDYFTLLGLDLEEKDPAVIKKAAERQLARIEPHEEGPNAKSATRLIREIEKARETLLSPVKRKAYLATLESDGADAEEVEEIEEPELIEEDDEEEEKKPAPRKDGKGKKKGSGKKKEKEPASSSMGLWLGIGGGAVVLLGGIGGLVYFLTQPKPQPPAPPSTNVAMQNPPVVPLPAPPPTPAPTPPPVPVVVPPIVPVVQAPKPAPKDPLKRPPVVKPRPPIVKLPVPDQASQDRADKAIKETYKADYAKAKNAEGHLALATKLLQPGRENRADPAAWFVILREARDAANRAGRPRLAIEAIKDMETYFQMDGQPFKLQALAQATEQADGAKLAIKAALGQVEPAIAADNYVAARQFIDSAEAAARKIKADEKQLAPIVARRTEVDAMAKAFEPVAAAQAKLKANPADPDANLVVGKHLCLFHGRWDEGLPILGKGGEVHPAPLARKDLTPPMDVKAQLDVAEGWWRFSEGEKGRIRRNVLERTLAWYETAAPNMVAQERGKIEERMLDIRKDTLPPFKRLIPGSFFARIDPQDRTLLLREGGGNMKTEEAIERGLEWLANHQDSSGKWATDGFHLAGKCNCLEPGQKFDVAGTAFGLLPFLGAGETHKQGKYRKTVLRGLVYLLQQQKPEGKFSDSAYENALATIAICEALGQTRDRTLLFAPAQKAVNFIAGAQHSEGSWGYSPGAKGDTSVSGWQFSALKAGLYAGLSVPGTAFTRTGLFLTQVAEPNGLGFGYNTPGAGRATTATGVVCREYLGWSPRHPGVTKAIEHMLRPENFVSKEKPSIYFLFYATQAMHHAGGEAWESWNPRARELLLDLQDKGEDERRSHQKGSWSPTGDEWAEQGGRLMFTSLALLTLQVYYYHVPLNDFTPAVLED
ncbi:MAG: prenyltransferase/squalene oxidase repeat-containing protein [Gemmataceae bacterium]